MSLILSGTDGVSDIDGTVSTPAIRGTDSNTGIFFPAADTIAFSEGGVESMRITSSGNVGIGTSSPAFPLDVRAATSVISAVSTTGTNSAYMYASNTGGDFYFGKDNSAGSTFGSGTAYSSVVWSAGAYPMAFFTNATERMRIADNGLVCINTTTTGSRLTIDTKQNGYTDGIDISNSNSWGYGSSINFRNLPTNGGSLTTVSQIQQFYEASNKYGMGFWTYDSSLAERMRITSAGQLLVGTTSWTGGGSNNSGIGIKTTSTSAGQFAFYVDDSSSSNILNVRCDGSTYNTTGVWGTISDQRLKENIVDATPKLDNLLQLKVRNFNFTNDENKTKQIGFVAQEIEQVFPSLVSEDSEGTKAVKTTVLLPMLVKAIQEQQAMIEELKAEVAALKASH